MDEQYLSQLREKTFYFKELNKILNKRLRHAVEAAAKAGVHEDALSVIRSVVELQRMWDAPLYCKEILTRRAHLVDFASNETKILDLLKKATSNYRLEPDDAEVQAALKKDLGKLNTGTMTDELFPHLTDGAILVKIKESIECQLSCVKQNKILSAPSQFSVPIFCIQDLTKIGFGGFADVYRGKYEGQEVAVKVLRGFAFDAAAINVFDKEIKVLCSLRSPYVVQFIGANSSPECMAILMEFIPGGTLEDYLARNTNIPFDLKLRMAKEIMSGLQVLHSHKMLHCDLKPANVLLDADKQCKLADFGMTIVKNASTTRMTVCVSSDGRAFGTLHYMAPELFAQTPKYSVSSDVYAGGMILWQLGTQKTPYENVVPALFVEKVISGYRNSIPDDLPRPFCDLISMCWHRDASARPPPVQIIEYIDSLMVGNVGLQVGNVGGDVADGHAELKTEREQLQDIIFDDTGKYSKEEKQNALIRYLKVENMADYDRSYGRSYGRSYAELKAELEQLQAIIFDDTGKYGEKEKEDANIKYEMLSRDFQQTDEYKKEVAAALEEKRKLNEPLNKAALEKMLKIYNPLTIRDDAMVKDKVLNNPELTLIGMDPEAILSKPQNDFQQYWLWHLDIEELRAVRASLPKFRNDQKRQLDWLERLEQKIEALAKEPRKKPSAPTVVTAKRFAVREREAGSPNGFLMELMARKKAVGGDDELPQEGKKETKPARPVSTLPLKPVAATANPNAPPPPPMPKSTPLPPPPPPPPMSKSAPPPPPPPPRV